MDSFARKGSAFGSRATSTGDRGSWIEEVTKNSMKDVAHRYESARQRKLLVPAQSGAPSLVCIRVLLFFPIMTPPACAYLTFYIAE